MRVEKFRISNFDTSNRANALQQATSVLVTLVGDSIMLVTSLRYWWPIFGHQHLKDTKIMVLSLDFVFCQLWSQLLSKWNGFDYYKLEPGDDPFQEEVKLSTFIKLGLKKAEKKREEHQDKTWPVFVFKHHYYYNTSRKGLNFYFQNWFTIFNAGISDMILDLMNFAARCCINKEMSPTFLTQINGNRSERLIEISTFMP